MIIAILNSLMFLYCVMASGSANWIDHLFRFCFMLLAMYNGFEAYRFYILGA